MSKTIEYFREISKIPRESGNEKEISEYIINFAKERNLEYITDKWHNVIVKKYVNDKSPIILQAHLDMVCVKDLDKNFDFKKDSIEVLEDNGYLKANGTSLGADNGVGVAQILNILDSDIDVSIEALLTTNEETTMLGALKIDLSSLNGRTMIGLDGFDADTILIESAGFNDIDVHLHYDFSSCSNNLYKVSLSGLEGGHSGFDINKNRGNGIILLANLLEKIDDIKLASFSGGFKINVIPSSAFSLFSTELDVEKIINAFVKEEKLKYPGLKIEVEKINEKNNILDNLDSKKFLASLSNFKQGVSNINSRGEVTTSVNLSIVDLEKNIMLIAVRSSCDEERLKILDYLNDYCNSNNYVLDIVGYQPGFKTSSECKLVKNLIKAYKMIDGNNPMIKSVHIGVEVGLIKAKISDLDVAIISPKIMNAHSTNECVLISSIKKCDEWLYNYLMLIR